MGYRVAANDWEEYSRIINTTHLTLSPDGAEQLFSDLGGIESVLQHLNKLHTGPVQPLISRYYAPASTEQADYRTERLFYTRENALFIDRVREEIDRLVPDGGRAHDLLMALLLYEAATHVNTSGVFKAYHKGFGGHSRDALRRIMSPMRLEYPVLITGPADCEVQQQDAADFLHPRSGDLCYLDPPYNIHQYGSNYHLLNTISRWDFPPINNDIGPDGRLAAKAGIRQDWKKTRSDFCSRVTAPAALRKVLAATDARWVVLSYNSEGIIPMEQLIEILSEFGRIEINSLDYITYRGGRQSMNRRTYNTEFQLVVERHRAWGKARTDAEQPNLQRFLPAHRIQSLLQGAFVPRRLRENFQTDDSQIRLWESLQPERASPAAAPPDSNRWLNTENLYTFCEVPSLQQLQELPLEWLQTIEARLEQAACRDRQEELAVVRRLMCAEENPAARRRYQKKVLHILKKFTHKKYRREWEREIARLQELLAEDGAQLDVLRAGLKELIDLGRRRFEG